jgi:hypothetical protein
MIIEDETTYVLVKSDVVEVDRMTPRAFIKNVLGPDVESTWFDMATVLSEPRGRTIKQRK